MFGLVLELSQFHIVLLDLVDRCAIAGGFCGGTHATDTVRAAQGT